jgi:O-antigen/teichoic acid export membrane protein
VPSSSLDAPVPDPGLPEDPDAPSGSALPEGAVVVAIGLLVAGISTYAFFRVGTSALGGDTEFAPIAALWFAMFALAPGFFLPLEQELGRALAHRRAIGQGGRPVVKRIVALAVIISIVVVAVIAITSPWVTSAYFDGDWLLLVALAVAFVSYAPVHLTRGICSGTARFGSFAFVVGSDGVVKIIATIALAAIGITAVGPYAFVVALSPLLAVAIVWSRGTLATPDGPPAPWREVTQNFGWLLLGTACAAVLVNAGPMAANLLASDTEADAVTRFSYGVLLARVPLFMFQAIQASLLPRLARLAARRDYDDFRKGLKLLILVVAAIGAIGTTAAWFLGPWILDLVYGADLSGRTIAMLALSSAIYMLALAMSQAVLALEDHAQVAIGWISGILAFVVGTWLAGDQLFRRIEIGLVASSVIALAWFSIALKRRLAIIDQT